MIDSHAHILASQFDSDREDIIMRTQADGLIGWIEVGTTVMESTQAASLAERHSFIFASVGVHPDEIGRLQEQDWATLRQLAGHPKVCAIGEVGLDTFRNGDITDQEPVLRTFIEFAHEVQKPVIFHVRSGNAVDCHAELLRVLSSYPSSDLPKGVIHTFSGTMAQANAYIAHGMMISFSGVITFKNAGALVEIAKNIPLESLLVETDCPFLTPEPFRGKRNEPSYVRYVIKKISDIRGVSFEDIERATEDNAKALFGVDFS